MDKEQKFLIKSSITDIMTNVTTQKELNNLEVKLIEKIDELNKKLEIIKSKQWKFKVNDIVIYDKFVYRITELIDDGKHLYKAERYDYTGVIDKAGFKLDKGTVENYYFDTNDNLIKLESWTDYAAQLFKLAVKREKEIID